MCLNKTTHERVTQRRGVNTETRGSGSWWSEEFPRMLLFMAWTSDWCEYFHIWMLKPFSPTRIWRQHRVMLWMSDAQWPERCWDLPPPFILADWTLFILSCRMGTVYPVSNNRQELCLQKQKLRSPGCASIASWMWMQFREGSSRGCNSSNQFIFSLNMAPFLLSCARAFLHPFIHSLILCLLGKYSQSPLRVVLSDWP